MPHDHLNSSVGVVETKSFVTCSPPHDLVLKSGERLGPITLAYETYGTLNAGRSNAILILHALTGDAHAAGFHHGDQKPGWWDIMIGPGKAFDTNKYLLFLQTFWAGAKEALARARSIPKPISLTV